MHRQVRVTTWRPTVDDNQMAKWKADIDHMTHEECARLWRFGASDHPIIQTPELWKHFVDHFADLGGWTPAVSKAIGW